jgi:hypothetical protein
VCAEPLTSGDPNPWRCLDLVISEIQLGATGFMELYNRFCLPVSLEDCQLVIQGGADVRAQTVELVGNISSGGFYLVGLGVDSADLDAGGATVGTNLAAGTSLKVELFCHGQQLDLVEVGTSSGQLMCAGFFAPTIGFMRSVERKAVAAATTTSMQPGGVHELAGNAYRSGNNLMDFICRPSPQPQSSRSPAEAMGCR